MAYATLMHFMTQLSRRSLSSLGRAPFVWQVRLGIYFSYVLGVKNYFGYVVMVLWIFQVWMYEYFGVGPEI